MGLEIHPCMCSTTALQSIYVNVNSIQCHHQSVDEETVALVQYLAVGGGIVRVKYTQPFFGH